MNIFDALGINYVDEAEETKKALLEAGVVTQEEINDATQNTEYRKAAESLAAALTPEGPALEKPKTWKEEAIENHGKGGYLMRRLATKIPILTPDFVDEMIMPELRGRDTYEDRVSAYEEDKTARDRASRASKALGNLFDNDLANDNASIFALNELNVPHQVINSLPAVKRAQGMIINPHMENLARMVEERDPLRAAVLRASPGLKDYDPNAYSLSQGQSRFEGIFNTPVASVAPKPPEDQRASTIKEAQELAASVGLDYSRDENGNFNNPSHGQAYGQILAAVTSGTLASVDGEGRQVTINHIASAMDNARQMVQQTSQGAAGNGAGANGTGVAGGIQTGLGTVQQAVNEKEATEVAGAQDELDFWEEVGGVLSRLGTYEKGATAAEDRFVAKQDLKSIYGPLDSWYPDGIRGGGEQDMIAEIERLNSLLSVEERQKLQGQGQITEGEQKMLTASLSTLMRARDGMNFGGGISDQMVERELARIYAIMERSRERAQKRKDSIRTPTPVGSNDIDALVNKHLPQGN